MKPTNIVAILTTVTILTFAGCTHHGKYDNVKEAFNKLIDADTHFTAQLEKVSDAADLAAALNEYASALEEFQVTYKNLQAKYPEMFSQKNPPPELQETIKGLDSTASGMDATYQAAGNAIAKYNDNPLVVQAAQRYTTACQETAHLLDPQ